METANPPNPSACDSAERGSAVVASSTENATLEKLLRGTPLSEHDWALEAELRGVQRLLGSLKSKSELANTPLALHARHTSPPHRHTHATSHSLETEDSGFPPVPKSQPRGHTAAWIILSLGLAVFACGAVLLGWSLIGQREDLWPVGMPLALIGQAGLVLGLILQLDGLWNSSRKTEQALTELDGELKTVRHATTLLSTSQASSAQSFYLHLAEGASPHLLLSDLKGQMDLLAQQMARQAK